MPQVTRTLDAALKATDSGWTYDPSYFVRGVTSEVDVFTAADDTTGLTVPKLGDEYNGMHCYEVVPERLAGDVWRVEAKFKARTVSAGGDFDFSVPKPRWQWVPITVNKPKSTDINNKPLRNSAGDPLIGSYDDEENAMMLRVRLVQPFYDPSVSFTYRKRVNAGPLVLFGIWPIAAGNLKCTELKPLGEQQLGDATVEVEYEFELREGYRPFDEHATDKGFNGWWSDGGTLTAGMFYWERATGGASEPVSEAVLLDGTGKPISSKYKIQEADDAAQQTPVTNTDLPDNFEIHPDSTADAKTLIFDTVRAANFSGFIPGIM